ncbi:hypothetical protein AALP_AA2G113900 [Arabis alpina]|uniref:peroxidase n=1 Tax=Arabis alpina TaxID=50452 RepID=A0A087HGR0_ARAAL|nr:hypothetical protein AALP_AA2G113900 [Arabis alpina]
MKLFLVIFIVTAIFGPCFSFDVSGNDFPLTLDYYKSTCPTVFDVIKKEMECIVKEDPRNAAIIIRLHFHDCFVQGCDASVLLDDTESLQGEKTASPNINSLRGYKIVDRIKNIIESECPGVVSCADLLTISARDATILVGGPYWDVPVGRKDSKTASYALATSSLPTPEEGLISIISKFYAQGLSVEDTVALIDYYKSTCPTVFDVIKQEMERIVNEDPRNAAIVIRLHFHDCFAQGCDGSVLLDDTRSLQGEKKAAPNIHSVRGYKIVDRIKKKIESECPGVVSCADLLTIAARDATVLVGGPYWDVPVGRKDSKTASYELATSNLPTPEEGLTSIISKFYSQGLSVADMVALSGAHTIGMAQCRNFRSRIYGDFKVTSATDPVSETYLASLREICPASSGRADGNETAIDNVTPNLFDNSIYHTLLRGEGLLSSDQEMYTSMFGIQTRRIVKKYAEDPVAFFEQFSESMVKMGNILNSDSFVDGEVRRNCRFVNK